MKTKQLVGRGYNRYNIPPKEKTVDEELKELIVRVCDNNKLIENVIGLSEVLISELENYEELIMKTIFDCAKALSYKTSIYSSLVSIILSSKRELGSTFYDHYRREFIQCLKNKDYYAIKLIVRFSVELYNSNVFSKDTVTKMLLELLSHVMPSKKREYNDPTPPKQYIGDFYVGVILSSVILSKDQDIYTQDIHDLIKRYMELRLPLPSSIFDDEYLRENIEDEDEDLFNAMLPYYSNGDWLQKLFDIFDTFVKSGKRLESTLCPWKNDEVNRQSLYEPLDPNFNIFGDMDSATISDIVLFSLCASTDICMFAFPHTPIKLLPYDLTLRGKLEDGKEYDLSPMEKWLLDDYIQDVLHFFKVSPKDAVAQLQMVPFNFEYIEAYLCEVIIGEMLRTPSPHKYVYYGHIIMELCKTYFETFPSFLGGSIDTIFRRANSMDFNSLNTFINWFSFHLSNFDFKWDWKKWVASVSPEEDSEQVYLIKETLVKLLGLSYYERIVKSVPEECKPFLPLKLDTTNIFSSRSSGSDEDSYLSHPISIELFRMLESSTPVDEIKRKIEEICEQNIFSNNVVINILTRALLTLGTKSMTSLSYVIGQYKELLIDLKSETSMDDVLNGILEHYHTSSQHIIISSLQMLRSNVLKPVDIIKFSLCKDHLKVYGGRMFTWELLDRTILSTLEELKSNSESSPSEKDTLFMSIFEAFGNLFKDSSESEKTERWYKLSLGYFDKFIKNHFYEIKAFANSNLQVYEDMSGGVQKIIKEFVFLSTHY